MNSIEHFIDGKTLNKRLVWKDGFLIDKKYKYKYRIGDSINVYDSKNDEFINIASHNINRYIQNLPDDKRHWIQFVENEQFKTLLLNLSPRIKYIFQ